MENLTVINAKTLQKAFLKGASNIEFHKEYINELNVFPVPDGDTGTNMSLTIMAAAKEVGSIENPTIQTVAKAMSTGSLRGARGNSGVILSQLFRGFCKEISGQEELTVKNIADGFHKAVETAYKAVMKPKEGTILTVARGMAEKASEMAARTDDMIEFGEAILVHGKEVLERTPDMLPVLKEAGVVDSGGQGLITILEGAFSIISGTESEIELPIMPSTSKVAQTKDIDTSHIQFGYCTEFIIVLEKAYNKKTETEFKSYLGSIGDSLVVVSDEDIVKVHVHTNHPGLAFEKALLYGSLTSMKVDNMREEHQEKVIKEAEKQMNNATEEVKEKLPYGFITVSIGEGLGKIFKELGVSHIIEGGQTMNPSTEDILNAIEQVNAEVIYILPNNKNIILAANQAQSLVEDKEIIVLPSKTIPQGIAALLSFSPVKNAKENLSTITEDMKLIKTGQVTYAVRDTNIDGKEIKIGDIMGLDDSTIQAVSDDVFVTTKDLLDALIDEDAELISVYYGTEISENDASVLLEYIEEKYEDLDVEMHYGGQPIYYYIISVE